LTVVGVGVVLVVLGFGQSDSTHRDAELFVGLVLMLVGLVTDLITDVASRVRERRKRCPMCAENVHRAARICRYCGHAFDPPDER
jgi:multisubunit Na+/H+ antiporter MnhB subunit